MANTAFERQLTVDSDQAKCWEVLTDVPKLVSWVSIVDGAQELAHLDHYTAVLMDRLGPFKMKADLDIRVSELEEPGHIRVRAEGEDRQVASRLVIDAALTLTAVEGGCLVAVAGTYDVIGKIATLGAGVIKQKATKILDEFFKHAGAELGER